LETSPRKTKELTNERSVLGRFFFQDRKTFVAPPLKWSHPALRIMVH